VDLALHHPDRAEDVTLGVLCDGTRFGPAQDPVEWDVFRTAIHESQGWRLHRVWSPSLFRDIDGGVRAILREASDVIAREEPKDSIRASTSRAPARESE
jgi:very-short-patch-repair endonuclease